MFESAELGRRVSKEEFERRVPELNTRLVDAQQRLRHTDTQVFVIIAGVEGAHKSDLVDRLNRWLDNRLVRTYAFWDETDEERERPYFWRFWRSLPPRGTIGIMFDSWYARPIGNRVAGNIDDDCFDRAMQRIAAHERMLADDGALILKFWLHLGREELAHRLEKATKSPEKGTHFKLQPAAREYAKRYDEYAGYAERALRRTDTAGCPWYVVEATDQRYCELTVGRTLLEALSFRLEQGGPPALPNGLHRPRPATDAAAAVTVLDRVALDARLERDEYKRLLRKYQLKVNRLAWKALEQKRSTVVVLEGWDAAGKGGAIRRLTAAMDARLYRVYSVGVPSDEERAQHYLWRFWRQLPRAGYFRVYDRSWYGRLLVERVEGYASDAEWARAYHEINEFEELLVDHGIVLCKFWLHIDADEQLRRFRQREEIPWKQHKIGPEDWRNRERRADYLLAVEDMVDRTSTAAAPWQLVPANDKRYARIEVLKAVARQLKSALG